MFQRVTEVVREAADHLDGVVGMRMHLGGDAIEGIEQKMRVELGPEHLEFHPMGLDARPPRMARLRRPRLFPPGTKNTRGLQPMRAVHMM